MPAVKQDYYETLSVARTADGDEIKKSYRRLAMKFHPDRNGGDAEAEAKFREAAEAYEVLSDPQKRQRYDQYGHAGVQGTARDYQHVDVGDIFSMFEDIFGFGGVGSRAGPRGGGRRVAAGMDLETQIELTLEEVAVGVDKTLEFQRQETCTVCNGDGVKPGASPKTCPTCNGQGRVAQQGFGGMFRMVVACPTCRGRGQVVEPRDVCDNCRGEGKVKAKRTVQVKVPAGVHEGQAVRLGGEGEPGDGPGAPAGDLLCYIAVRPHAVFSRHNNDLVCQVPVSFTQAALGAAVDVPTLRPADAKANGQKTPSEPLDVPGGTQHGEVFKLKGKGLPDVRGFRKGDLLVQVMVEVPKKLTDRQRKLLEEFAETEHGGKSVDRHAAMPQRKGFLDKLKAMISPED